MIEGGELSAFVRDMYVRTGDRMAWDFFLDKVQGMSFQSFRDSLAIDEPGRVNMTEGEIVRQTFEIAGLEVG